MDRCQSQSKSWLGSLNIELSSIRRHEIYPKVTAYRTETHVFNETILNVSYLQKGGHFVRSQCLIKQAAKTTT